MTTERTGESLDETTSDDSISPGDTVADEGFVSGDALRERDERDERASADESVAGDEATSADETLAADDGAAAPATDGAAALAIPSGPEPPIDMQSAISLAVARLSDRALARVVGANAYLRGRVYARQKLVHTILTEGPIARARVHGKSTEPYDVKIEVSGEGQFISLCSCPAWRGPERHCKHIAALLVALRDRVRPPRTDANVPRPAPQQATSVSHEGHGDPRSRRNRRGRRDDGHPREVVVVDRSGPRVVSTGGATTVQSTQAVQSAEYRAGFGVWIPGDEPRKAPEYEYRLQVRSASIAITPIQQQTRVAMTSHDALDTLGAHPCIDRPALHLLSKLQPRGSRNPMVEARGEDAAALIGFLKGRRVLLEPTLMELRYADDALYPRFDLDLVPPASIRVRVLFERRSDGRRFTLSQGLWLEGRPCWHIDTAQGVARPVADFVTDVWLERFSRAPAVTHPTSDIGRLLGEIVPRVALLMNAPLPDIQSIVDIADATPTFILRATGDLVNVNATLTASYGEIELAIPPLELPPPLAIIPGDSPRPRCIRRDVGAEREAVDKLLEAGLEVSEDTKSFQATGDRAVAFWTEGVGSLPENWDRFIPDDLVDVTVRDTPVGARARVSSGIDWLSVDVEFSSEGSSVTEDELRRALAGGHKLVKLADGTYAPIERGKVEDVLLRMSEIFAQGKKKLPLAQAGRVQDLVNALDRGASVGTSAKDFLARMGDRKKIDEVPLPKKLKATMRPYQHEGFSWLVFLHNMKSGGVLADDMGLGKTLEAIALLAWIKQQTNVADAANDIEVPAKVAKGAKTAKAKAAAKDAAIVEEPAAKGKKAKATKVAKGKKGTESADVPPAETPPTTSREAQVLGDSTVTIRKGPLALVIAPTSVVANWVREIEKFAPHLKAVAWSGADRERIKDSLAKADVVVTSYALLRRDEEFLASLECGYGILDEAQQIKNPMSATARAAKRLNCERRLALTGTPIENRLSEIWSIFDYVSPGLLGGLSQFEERYARPIDRGDEEASRRLRNAIHPFVMRRTKLEVAKDLPEKIVTELLCEMPPAQASLYKTVLRSVRDSVLGEVERVGVAKSQIQILAGLTRLRQASCDPRLLKLPGTFTDDDSGKLVALRELISEAIQSGHRTLVFSQFVSMLTLIRSVFDADGIKYEYLDGSTLDRQERVDRFNRTESIPVFLISLKAGGTGLNLVGADTVVHFDPWWNPAVEDQATDRAHRIGQTRVVTAYRLVARGTIEEKILSLSAKKRELVANVLGKEEEGALKGFTRSEVEDLFATE